MQPAPRIVDIIGHVAARAPQRPAIVVDGEVVSYAALQHRIACVAGGLHGLGVRPGQTVAVGATDSWLQILLLVALDQCGVRSGLFRVVEGAGCRDLLAAADLVLTDTEDPPGPCRQHRVLAPAWLAEVCAARWPAVAAVDADPAMAVIRSSGTTGQPKRLLLTRTMLAARCAQRIAAYGLGADSRFLMTTTPSAAGTVVRMVVTWQLGGMVVMERRLPLWLAAAAAGVTHMALLPRQLAAMLAELPSDFTPQPQLRLIMNGARLPAGLRADALARLAGSIVDYYATNETGLICPMDADGQGLPVPGQTVAILAPDGARLPPGVIGRVAVCGPSVADGYLDAPALTAKHFRDGWFLTDDLAMELEDGRLRLIGRSEDVLNVGGFKVACADLEAELCRDAALADAAVLPGADAATPPVIACVLHPPETLVQAERRIRDCLPDLLAEARLCVVAAIPRTMEGKLRRPELRAMLGE